MASVGFVDYTGFPGLGGINMDQLHLSDMLGVPIQVATSTRLLLQGNSSYDFTGTGFTYDLNDQITGGTLTAIDIHQGGPHNSELVFAGLNLPIAPFAAWILTDSTQTALTTMLAGNDTMQGSDAGGVDGQGHSSPGDLLRGYDGNDVIVAGSGPDTVFGGNGDDTIYGASTFLASNPFETSYLRGDDGNDSIVGAGGFDDINGNKGNDTIDGGAGGGDWLVGGQNNDLITAHTGQNILYGNLGDDTLNAGSGGDLMRGGQGNDILLGGAGNDWLSGDRGNDTLTGGAGADTFHTFSGAGIDRVLDFHIAEGDKVQVDAGTTWTVTQVGSDTVIDMGGGDQMILVGVQASTLTGGWIFTL